MIILHMAKCALTNLSCCLCSEECNLVTHSWQEFKVHNRASEDSFPGFCSLNAILYYFDCSCTSEYAISNSEILRLVKIGKKLKLYW